MQPFTGIHKLHPQATTNHCGPQQGSLGTSWTVYLTSLFSNPVPQLPVSCSLGVGGADSPVLCPIYRFYKSTFLSSTQFSGLSFPKALGDRHLYRHQNYAFVTLSKFKELNDTESGISGDTSPKEKPCLSFLYSFRETLVGF